MGFPHQLTPVPWGVLEDRYRESADGNPHLGHMYDIVHSVISSESTARLAATTSLHDLLVTPCPVAEPPLDVVAVRSPVSVVPVPRGFVVIEHLAVAGHNDRIERPVADAVPLFWRFMIEKYGVAPVCPPTTQRRRHAS